MSTELLLCNRPLSAQELHRQCALDINNLTGLSCQKPVRVTPYQPYLTSSAPSAQNRQVLSQLSPLPVAKSLTGLTLSYGQDNLYALMGIGDKLHQAGVSTTGASTAVFSNR